MLMDRRTLLAGLGSSFLIGNIGRVPGFSEAASDSLVVEAEQVQKSFDDFGDQLVVLDCRPLRDYRSGHLPRATHAWWQNTVDPNYPYYGAVLTQGQNQRFRREVVAAAGITTSSVVVAYDDINGFRAARWVWFLRFLGFQASLFLAGTNGWTAAGYSLEAGVEIAAGVPASPIEPAEGYYLVTRQLIDRLNNDDIAIVDTRTEAERMINNRQIPRQGAIPGSVKVPWNHLMTSDKSSIGAHDQAIAQIEELDLASRAGVVVYANYGVDTAFSWLMLKAAGLDQVTVYDRGWVEWSNRSDLPVVPFN